MAAAAIVFAASVFSAQAGCLFQFHLDKLYCEEYTGRLSRVGCELDAVEKYWACVALEAVGT
jgi:hypothetical protein